MAAKRLLSMSRPSGFDLSNKKSSNLAVTLMLSRPRTVMCLSKVGLSSGGGERKPVAAKAAGKLVSEPKTDKGVELLLAYVGVKLSEWMKLFHIQMLVEKAIIDCRFFSLLATVGSLLGSVRCFVEGCFLVLESYFQYFHSLSQISEQGYVVLLLIEAIDMFIVGTTMLVFGMALHVMFVGHDNFKGRGSQYKSSILSRNLNLQKLPSWIGMESASEAKLKIGHAVIMILQVQVLEKSKSIAVTNGFDLACFAGAIFMSSASIFLLSRTWTKGKGKKYTNHSLEEQFL